MHAASHPWEPLPVLPELGSVPPVLPTWLAAQCVPVSDLPEPCVVLVMAGSWEPMCRGSGWVGEFMGECLPPWGVQGLQLGPRMPGARHPHRIPLLSSERCLQGGEQSVLAQG